MLLDIFDFMSERPPPFWKSTQVSKNIKIPFLRFSHLYDIEFPSKYKIYEYLGFKPKFEESVLL